MRAKGDLVCDPSEDGCGCPQDCGTPPGSETSCTDGIDEDCDGAADCQDPDGDCATHPDCSCRSRKAPCSSDNDCCSNSCNARKGTCR
ncbi:hypothetical protein ACFLU6_06175 [Acidobacteriota bacterium]